jgi:methionyl-tRNA formyltransferase
MKILFMGTPDYAKIILQSLIDKYEYEIVGVYTQPDKPVGRKKTLTPPPVKVLAKEYNIPVFQPNNLKNESNNIKKLNPDFIIVAAFGQILPKEILQIAPCINLHASLLPKYRGASPIQSAILNGDRYTGITAMKMDVGLDTGDILGYEYCEIGEKLVVELFKELSNIAANLTSFIIDNYENIKPLKQNDAISTYSPKITKNDGKIEFDEALQIWRKYKAFYYWPGIWTDKFKLKQISFIENYSINNAGEILDIKKNSIIIGCKKGSIEIFKIQPHSKKEMDVISYLNGQRLKIGDNLL